jgi:glutathione S-transferase
LAVNPKGQVPALLLDNGVVLTEGPAIVQYIADQAPQSGLAPANGTLARYQLQSWLNYIGTEVHKGFSPLFAPNTPDDYKPAVRERLLSRFQHLDTELGAGGPYLMGDPFTVADAYLFTVSRWCAHVGVDITGLRHVQAYLARVGERPAVQQALRAEGLLKN